MDLTGNSSRAQANGTSSETGLAEWTSKIKAMQRQVDADDEAEQKRLEDEIAASRLARMRRSRVGGSRTSLDLTKSQEYASVVKRDNDTTMSADLKPAAERQKTQADVLRTLAGGTSSPDSVSSSLVPHKFSLPSPSYSNQTSLTAKKPEPVSLAAFMGGRASGPRLNKHLPQQDAHDPTQFEQRTRITAPHPIFGKGGVAMPGMLTKDKPAPSVAGNTYSKQSLWSSADKPRERAVTMLPVGGTSNETNQEREIPQQNTGDRERRISTPGTTQVRIKATDTLGRPDSFRRPVSGTSLPGPSGSDYSRGSYSSTPRIKTPPTSTSPIYSQPYTPRQQSAPLASVSPPSKSSPIVTPSLARPIKPDPRPSPQAPQIPPSQNPSPAFLRPQTQKDPSPSISRLKGRGFVQSMVKASSQSQSFTPTGTAEASLPDHKTRIEAPRKSSVLDRWQPAASIKSVSPPTSPSPMQIRKSRTVNASEVRGPPLKTTTQPVKYLKTVASLPSLSQNGNAPASKHEAPPAIDVIDIIPRQHTPGLGSATTMMIIKHKTGEGANDMQGAEPPSGVDELGMRHVGGGVLKSPTKVELPTSSGRPLVHPTKDRARRPRKPRGDNEGKTDASSGSGTLPGKALLLPAPKPDHDAATPSPPSVSATRSAAPIQHSQAAEPGHQSSSPLFPTSDKSTTRSVQRTISPTPLPSVEIASSFSNVTDRWAHQSIIGVKPFELDKRAVPRPEEVKLSAGGMVGRQALPGLAATDQGLIAPALGKPSPSQDNSKIKTETNGSMDSSSSAEVAISVPSHSPIQREDRSPTAPGKHARIPSTGNRATVMDVAQSFSGHQEQAPTDEGGQPDLPPASVVPVTVTESPPPPPVVSRLRNILPPGAQAEKRKSSYEKYSGITLPPLQEEKTPVQSPAGTLSRVDGLAQVKENLGAILSAEDIQKALGNVSQHSRDVPTTRADVINFNHVDDPLPVVDVASLVKGPVLSAPPDAAVKNISVEVMTITVTTATPLTRDTAVFYDTEILAIIHRSKLKSTGLASTAVWAWRGKNSQAGDREERKLQDLAKRYGTSLVNVYQQSEPVELVRLLGGRLAIRQGLRAHWSTENTTMHLVRCVDDVIFIDEHDLSIKNLCSGFSYCLSILDTLYVWYGCGSTATERKAALEYAQSLATNGTSVIELTEGEDDKDEMFWTILGDEEFARADYWKWRKTSNEINPRVWRVDAGAAAVQPVHSLAREISPKSSVYLLDCVWEYFILVGRQARGKRRDIRLAINVAMGLSSLVASSRPYPPTIHVLVFPSQLPLDLRLSFRDIDDVLLNEGEVPDHMNIIACHDALEHLRKNSWDKTELGDQSMLPLGLSSSDIPMLSIS